jgi:hypothetical protein
MPAACRSLLTAFTACFVLMAGAHRAAGQVVLADLNGDGIRDRIEVTAAAGELVVRTSPSSHAQRLRTPGRLERVIVSDINQDGRIDIIATTGRSGVVVWVNSGRGRFRPSTPVRQPIRNFWPRRNADNAPLSNAIEKDTDAFVAGLLPPPRPKAVLDVAVRLSVQSAPSSVGRRARPRVPRGPPLSLLLV